MPDACGCCSTTRRRRDKSGGIRHDPDPQQRTPPLVGGGGDPEQLHGLTRSTTSASRRHRSGHAPIRSTGLGRGTCLPQKRFGRRADVSVGCRRASSSLESLSTTGHHPQMHRQLKAGRRVCRRELLEASAQPMAFSSDERERLPLLSGALTGDDANAAAVRGVGLNRTASGCLIQAS